MAAVRGRIDPVAGEAARQQARERLAAEAVGCEVVGAVGEGDDEVPAAAGPLALEQRGQNLGDRA